jgi:hypothetical protein
MAPYSRVRTFSASPRDISPSGLVSLSYVCLGAYRQGMSYIPAHLVPREDNMVCWSVGL